MDLSWTDHANNEIGFKLERADYSGLSQATDESGQGHHGSLLNGPTWVPDNAGGLFTFDGVDDYIDVGYGFKIGGAGDQPKTLVHGMLG